MSRTELDSYHVLELTTPNGDSWTSIHRTEAGAKERLHEKVLAWGLEDQFKADKLDYGISYLPVED